MKYIVSLNCSTAWYRSLGNPRDNMCVCFLQVKMFLQKQRQGQEKLLPFWYSSPLDPTCQFMALLYAFMGLTNLSFISCFQLPAIELLSTLPRSPSINLLVICPTRELANQVAAEARKLLKYHRSLGVQVVIGGTKLPQEQRSMQSNPCQVVPNKFSALISSFSFMHW